MRLELVSMLLFISVLSFADWQQNDSYTLQNIYSEVKAIRTGSNGQYMSMGDWSVESYRLLSEIADAKTYDIRYSGEGYQFDGVTETSPFSNKNESMFQMRSDAQDNTNYYMSNIYSHYYQGNTITYDHSVPDQFLFDYPFEGNLLNNARSHADDNNLGISSIISSQQTQQLRDRVDSANNAFTGMFSSDYTNSVLNYDFSEIGNFFVRSQVMQSNPFANLRGSLRIKPVQGQDYLYDIWHLYFDRDYSSYAITLYYCLYVLMYMYLTYMVINDMMSIVGA